MSPLTSVLFVIYLITEATVTLGFFSTSATCPRSFTHFGGSVNGCYKLILKSMDWDEANTRCQRLNPSAHLVFVDSPAKQQAMEDIMRPFRELIDENCYHPCVMIGAQRINPSVGTSPFVWNWKYPNGTQRSLGYTNWNAGEPNDDATHIEACARIYPDWDYQWNDVPCWMDSCFMCEIDI